MLKQPEFKQAVFGSIEPWQNNPRNIQTPDLERLARSISEKGQFQVLTCWPVGNGYDDYPQEDTGKYMTGGGNMRWHAMKSILKFGPGNPVWISLNFPRNEAERIELALLDNQRSGIYIEEKLAELIYPIKSQIILEDFKIDLSKTVTLKDFIGRYGPNADGQEEKVEFTARKKPNKCPKCGWEY
jgi:hypothetical protein